MAIVWTTDEQKKINDQSLNELKPSYYYVPNRTFIQISEDMEGYLILQDQEEKQKILSWIKNLSSIETENQDRDTLLETFLGIRLQDTEDRIAELDTVLNQYAEMQTDLITDGDDSSRFATIMDLNLMLRSISSSVDMIMIQRDQAFHEKNLITALSDILAANKSDDDTQKELSSWQTVVSSYKGQSGKSASKKAGISKLGPVF